jgi:hypothetical protein
VPPTPEEKLLRAIFGEPVGSQPVAAQQILTPTEALIRNERAKLFARALNTLATATVTAGAIAPIIAAFWGVGADRYGWGGLLIGAAVWFLAGVGSHCLASLVLGIMRQP